MYAQNSPCNVFSMICARNVRPRDGWRGASRIHERVGGTSVPSIHTRHLTMIGGKGSGNGMEVTSVGSSNREAHSLGGFVETAQRAIAGGKSGDGEGELKEARFGVKPNCHVKKGNCLHPTFLLLLSAIIRFA